VGGEISNEGRGVQQGSPHCLTTSTPLAIRLPFPQLTVLAVPPDRPDDGRSSRRDKGGDEDRPSRRDRGGDEDRSGRRDRAPEDERESRRDRAPPARKDDDERERERRRRE
jgi:hypothetical protein